MPVTRSSSQQASQQPASQPYSSRRADPSVSGGAKKSSKAPSNEIIILSSDDDEPPPKGIVISKKSSSRTVKRKPAPQVHSGEVLELSSDDEVPSPRKQHRSPKTTKKDIDRTIKKLKDELKRYEREVEELKRDHSNEDVFAGMEEHTSCEVCTHTMWCPYILPECGHSFCETCLVDWFGATQAQHMTANPQLDNSRAALAGQINNLVQMIPNLHTYGLHGQQHVRAVLAEVRRHRPEYTCPSCRKQVLNKPVEDFRLKALINQIATMQGETNPGKGASLHKGSGPFDHFFAAPVR